MYLVYFSHRKELSELLRSSKRLRVDMYLVNFSKKKELRELLRRQESVIVTKKSNGKAKNGSRWFKKRKSRSAQKVRKIFGMSNRSIGYIENRKNAYKKKRFETIKINTLNPLIHLNSVQ